MRDEDEVRRPATHHIGDRLDDLSVEELDARIALLQVEIARLEAARSAKRSAAAAALSFFKS